MRKIIASSVGLLLTFGGLSTLSAPAHAAPKYSSCVSLNKKYPTGVAASSAAAAKLSSKFAKPRVDKAVYGVNKRLDKDKDQVICPVAAKAQVDPFAKAFGTFTATSYTGVGDDVIELPVGLKAGFVEVSHAGPSNFAIWAFDKDMERVDLLANEIGNYSGAAPFGFGFSDEPIKFLEVTAGGTWTVNIKPITDAPAFTGEGSGAGVFKGSIKGGSKTLTHVGSSNFAVWQYCTNGDSDLLANEIGSYTGRKIVKSGSCVIAVEADGTWSIK
jgi:hypothetical protein